MSDLSLCANADNGAWGVSFAVPPSTTPCEDTSTCAIPCVTDADCPGGTADGYGTGFCYGEVCACHKLWSGPLCDVPLPVPIVYCDGFRDANGTCCHGKKPFLGANHCSVTIAFAVLI